MASVPLGQNTILPGTARKGALMRFVVLLVAMVALFTAFRATGAEPVKNVEELEKRLEHLRQEVKIPALSAAIARDDSVVWVKGFGQADVEGQVPATPDTCYHLASLTKTFASTVILQLVEAGKIDLDSPISKYRVTLNESQGMIRVKHLMSHTSEGVPGSHFKYNGDRYALLDQVIQSASGSSFGQLVCERIIWPLRLERTAPNILDPTNFALAGHHSAAFESKLARPYELDKSGQFKRIAYPKYFSCSAGLISSAPDVARYSIALDQGKLLTKGSLDRAMAKTPTEDSRSLPYGLGWFVIEHRGVKLVWHYGLWIGNSSLIIKVPSRRLTYVVLANSERLTSSYAHGRGELMTSPFARAFIEGFVTGDGQLPTAKSD
jgi:CubicO group peptidase (beta-lactamase class C family)